jgi:hypothetical protein
MSLARLLTLGRSLMAGEDRTNRYRLPHQRSLPTFGLGRNPFTAKAVPQADPQKAPNPSGRPAPVPPVAARSEPTPELPAAVELPPAAPAVAAEASPAASPAPVAAAVGPSVPRPTARRQPGWLARLNPFAVSRDGGAPARTASSAQNPRATQGELSLDQVRVVRNDLSEGEEDLVPVREARAARWPARKTAPEPEVEEIAVNRLKSSFKGVEQAGLF